MARPQRNSVDYFPFYCDEGNKMFYLEETYGNDGFATFVKILRELAKTDHHYLDLSKNTTKMFLSAKCKVRKETLESIINDLVDLEKFDKDMWVKYSIIWCQDFIDSIQDAYKNRSNDCMTHKGLIDLLISKGVIKRSKTTSKPPKVDVSTPVNPQTIVEYSKEDYRKEKYRGFGHLKINNGEFDKLESKYGKYMVDGILDEIENFKGNTKYNSLYLTALNWLKKRPKETKTTLSPILNPEFIESLKTNGS